MTPNNSLENLILNHIALEPPSGDGWRKVLCKVCNDHGKKGKRAAFRFESNGSVAYNCFNCSTGANDDPTLGYRVSKKMTTVLTAFGINEDDIKRINLARLNMPEAKKRIKEEKKAYKELVPKTIKLPPFFYPLALADEDDELAQTAIRYLKNDRILEPDSHIFLLSKPITSGDSPKLKIAKGKWANRLIIPVFFEDNVVWWQGRDLTDKAEAKYDSPAVPRTKILFGFEHILERSQDDDPLFVVEGMFDALLLDGVALLGNKFSDNAIQWLKRTRRPIVYIPDMWGDGSAAAKVALQQGWSISVPDLPNCKDITDGFKKYGKLFTLKQIHDNICNGFKANLKIKLMVG